MKDKDIKAYVKANKRGRELWSQSKNVDNPKKQERLQNKAKDAYAERDAYAMRISNPQPKVTKTEFKVQNSFNNNFNKEKSTNVNVKFGWFNRNKKDKKN